MALASVESVLLENDPSEAPKLAGWVRVKRSDVLLGATFERRWALLFSNRLELWKNKEASEERPRGTPKDTQGLHLLRRLRYMDHAPGTNKGDIVELYSHARTLFVITDDDTTWQTWMHKIDEALRSSSFDFRDESEKERDLYAGGPPPKGAYTPRSNEGSGDRTATPRTPRKSDPLLEFFKSSKSARRTSPNTPTSSPRVTQKVPSSSGVASPSKTPRTDSPKTPKGNTPKTPKRTEERV